MEFKILLQFLHFFYRTKGRIMQSSWHVSLFVPIFSLAAFYYRAIAQVVSRRLPTAVARVWSQVRSCGIYDGKNGIEAGFFRVLSFPTPILISPSFSIHFSSGAGTIGQLVADVPSWLSLTPPHEN
jgi:hypothetical protein